MEVRLACVAYKLYSQPLEGVTLRDSGGVTRAERSSALLIRTYPFYRYGGLLLPTALAIAAQGVSYGIRNQLTGDVPVTMWSRT